MSTKESKTSTSKMNVTRTTVINEAEKTTANARYAVSYTVSGGSLQNVRATVYEQVEREYPAPEGGAAKQTDNVLAGELIMEYSMFRTEGMGFPYSGKLPLYVSDFVEIINEITAPVTEAVEQN